MRRAVVAAFAALGLLLTVVTVTPVTLWWGRALSGDWREDRGSVLIVLGADDPTAGIVGQSTYWRTLYAYRAWQAGGFRTVVVSGGGGVAVSMKQMLVCSGIPAEAVIVEARSSSTRENALFTRELVSAMPGAKVLLTSDYHMFRARRTFEKAGIEVSPRPFPDVLKHGNYWRNRWNVFLHLAIETAKIAGYRWNGWI